MDKQYEVVECDRNDILLKYLVDHYRNDIGKIFPGIDLNMKQIDRAYVVLCQGKPVGMTLGSVKDGIMDLKLDYTIPEYRDCSIGSFLFDYLAKTDINEFVYDGPDENHRDYLEKTGFVKEGDRYIKKV